MSLIVWILFGAFVGWIASIIMKTNAEQGALGNIIVGIVGALIGGALSSMFNGPGVTAGLDLSSILLAVLGAVILLFFIRMLSGGKNTAER